MFVASGEQLLAPASEGTRPVLNRQTMCVLTDVYFVAEATSVDALGVESAASVDASGHDITGWHQRFGHRNHAGLSKRLKRLDFALPSSDDTECLTCVSSKVTRKPLASRERRGLAKQQLWTCMDYAGLMQVLSPIGHTGMVNILIELFHSEAVDLVRS
uniref:GAG-pre-integrase domain-containing protein n=1 Tax=Peronospora matthiolae TaxID=2874970 RepID=A0AAV1U3L6_9STRA